MLHSLSQHQHAVYLVSATVNNYCFGALSAGIPEDLLVGQLDALAPQSARDMLAMLVAARLLRLETAPAPRHGPPAIFSAAGHLKPSTSVRTVVGDQTCVKFCWLSGGPSPMSTCCCGCTDALHVLVCAGCAALLS